MLQTRLTRPVFGRRPLSRWGFTLIETLLGLTIFAIVAAGLYGVLFGALRLDKKVKSVHERCHEIRMAFGILSRDIENAIPYPFDVNSSDRLAFEGKTDRMAFFVPTDEGVRLIEYYAGEINFGQRTETKVRRVKTIRESDISEESDEAHPYLLRREKLLADILFGKKDQEDDVQAIAAGLQDNGVRFRYGQLNGTGAGKQVVFKDEWKSNRLPDVVRVECMFYDSADPEHPVTMKRDIYLIVKEIAT